MNSGSFKYVINKMYLRIIYLINIYKYDVALNNLQWLIWHKTKPNNIIGNLHSDNLRGGKLELTKRRWLLNNAN